MTSEINNSQFSKVTVTLYLLNEKGYKVLLELSQNLSYIIMIDAVIGARDKGNKEDYYEQIRQLCQRKSIPFFDRRESFENKSSYSIAIGWRWLIFNSSKLIILHDSLLPKYRGFSPLVNMLINGEEKLGVSAIFATDQMDEGEIIVQESVEISYPIRIIDAIAVIAPLYAKIVCSLFKKIEENQEFFSVPQNESKATYSVWRDEDDYFINWNQKAEDIKRFVDAVGYPYDGAKTKTAKGEIIRVSECSIVKNIISEVPATGKILMIQNEKPIVLCGQGNKAIKLEKFDAQDGTSFKFSKLRTRLV